MEKQTETAEKIEKLKIRCPSCAKLYIVDAEDIQSSSPQFQCVTCDCRFTFAYPPENPENVFCSFVDAQSHNVFDELMKSQRSCPKCGALSPREAEECYSCHVIFSRLEGLPEDPTLRAQPSLVRKWKLLADDFENESKHEEFIQSCQELEALNFALSKYQDMKQVMGGDIFCERKIKRIHALLDSGLRMQKNKNPAAPVKKSNWKSYLLYVPYVFSAVMILWGAGSLGHRNLVGLGVATACLATGLILTLRGRLWH